MLIPRTQMDRDAAPLGVSVPSPVAVGPRLEAEPAITFQRSFEIQHGKDRGHPFEVQDLTTLLTTHNQPASVPFGVFMDLTEAIPFLEENRTAIVSTVTSK